MVCPIGFVSLGSTADIKHSGRRSIGDEGVGISTEVVEEVAAAEVEVTAAN
jgi:hypothetical protein